MERISWNEYFMAQSELLALRSTCTRLAVGATIVRDKRIIAGGYNGSIAGGVHCIDEGCYVIDNHCVRTIHAEMNAILQCAKFGVPTDGADIYVTHFPCLQCCKAIVQAGIKTVYYEMDYKNHPYALELFEQANIATVQVERKELEKIEEKKAFVESLVKQLKENNADTVEVEVLEKRAEELFSIIPTAKTSI
ncbi:ComE operon protein 2 [Cytobacillus oceanisediminis]|uniref:ComE operon protein 2 n=2 Tax=Niallia TaxID=2837506 RepID=A0A941GF86_NIACI|nr:MULTISPECIES: ComE operon protein 2 [Bacillaceae]EOR23709.1 cytidine deaminase ComEB [Niallia nealsonii AAU1]MBQ6447987.1 ComE operon protein 2 [Bacillus sp. (in: firmicutes)]MDU1844046.1 ComE operon protein 2 [Niallia nealsonii]MBZ9533030.1 ComE operon protein 2 [Cytobacillus oceanisediminis]MCB5235744.1 ComE operon protein 2 [Niallia circulans]